MKAAITFSGGAECAPLLVVDVEGQEVAWQLAVRDGVARSTPFTKEHLRLGFQQLAEGPPMLVEPRG